MKTTKQLWLWASVLAILLGAGITYAWFAQTASMSTLLNVLPPDAISILPVSGQDGSQMIDLDLDFHEEWGDVKNPDGSFHLQRYVCVKSTSQLHRLEVAHTANLNSPNSLDFTIFLTKQNTGGGFPDPAYSEQQITGDYINKNADTQLANPELLDNYQSSDNVESHAYPLYWIQTGSAGDLSDYSNYQQYQRKVNEYDPTHGQYKDFYYTYYHIQINWLADSKETDLFYIMAQNIAT